MKKVELDDSHFVPIIAEGGVATTETAEGRAIPVLILDCSNHKELLNLIYLHENTLPGDVMVTWGESKEFYFLLLSFSRPSIVEIGIKFDIQHNSFLADGIVQSQGVYLQPSESGKSVSEGMDETKLLIEIHPETKLPDWDKKLLKTLVKRLKKEGMSKKIAIDVAGKSLKHNREFWGLRVGGA